MRKKLVTRETVRKLGSDKLGEAAGGTVIESGSANPQSRGPVTFELVCNTGIVPIIPKYPVFPKSLPKISG
jgi:hypothetical protein